MIWAFGSVSFPFGLLAKEALSSLSTALFVAVRQLYPIWLGQSVRACAILQDLCWMFSAAPTRLPHPFFFSQTLALYLLRFIFFSFLLSTSKVIGLLKEITMIVLKSESAKK